jgi:hypothetical protein
MQILLNWTQLWLLISLARSACPTIAGLDTTYQHTDSSCLDISASFFSELLPLTSAAISSTGAALNVQTSTFYHVYTIGTAYGSAIMKLGFGALTVESCCISECSNEECGLAIDLGSADGGDISLTTFDSCGATATSTGRGIVFQETPMVSTYSSINVTSISLLIDPQTVSGFEASRSWGSAAGARFALSFSTFRSCHGGQVVIDSQNHAAGDLSTLDYCNFLESDVAVAILVGELAGMAVTNCIFSGAVGYSAPIFSLDLNGLSDSNKFRFANCVFPASLPQGALYSCLLIGANPIYEGPTSLWLTFFETELCPTATPTSSLSETELCPPMATALQSPSFCFTPPMNQISRARSVIVATSLFLFFGFDSD